jgi:hypothetical protein
MQRNETIHSSELKRYDGNSYVVKGNISGSGGG